MESNKLSEGQERRVVSVFNVSLEQRGGNVLEFLRGGCMQLITSAVTGLWGEGLAAIG